MKQSAQTLSEGMRTVGMVLEGQEIVGVEEEGLSLGEQGVMGGESRLKVWPQAYWMR